MAEVLDIDAIRKALAVRMERTGLKAKQLSKKAGLNETAVRDLMDRVTEPRLGTLIKLANALNCSASTLFCGLVELNGYIVGGGTVVDARDRGNETEYVPRPPDVDGELMAFRVDGDEHLPVYGDGDVVYVARNGLRPRDCLGKECVAALTTGPWVLRTLANGARPGLFNLRSISAPDLESVQIAWVAPTLFVMRKRINPSE